MSLLEISTGEELSKIYFHFKFKHVFRDVMGEQHIDPITVDKLPPPNIPLQVPPHTGAAVGSLDDSLQNCLSLAPKQPKKDVKKMLDYAGKTLRFSAELVSVLPVDKYRSFIISYFLEDDSLSIFEPARPNSGMR